MTAHRTPPRRERPGSPPPSGLSAPLRAPNRAPRAAQLADVARPRRAGEARNDGSRQPVRAGIEPMRLADARELFAQEGDQQPAKVVAARGERRQDDLGTTQAVEQRSAEAAVG